MNNMRKENVINQKEKDYKKLYREEKIFSFCLMGIMLILMIGLTLILFGFKKEIILYESLPPETKTTQINITYVGLTNEQKQNVDFLMEQINPIYLTRNKYFVFTIGALNEEDSWKGTNTNNGEKIEVQYTRDLQDMKNTICHEILHSYITDDSGDSDGHKIVYDLGDKGVCYKP